MDVTIRIVFKDVIEIHKSNCENFKNIENRLINLFKL